MSVKEIAEDMAALFHSGRGHEVGEKYWAEDAVSIEAMAPPGHDRAARGRAALEGKSKWWSDNHEVDNLRVDGPYINGDHVAFRFEMDVKVKADGSVMHMQELALYTLKDDQIAEERFLYGGF